MPYRNDLPQEVDRRVADLSLYPNVHVIFKAPNIISRFLYICERSFSALRRFRTWHRATMTEDRLCGLAMIHVHRNDTVGQVIPEAVLKRWDSCGNTGLIKPGKVGEILTLYHLKLPSLDSKAKLKLPCFFLQVAPFLQIICILW